MLSVSLAVPCLKIFCMILQIVNNVCFKSGDWFFVTRFALSSSSCVIAYKIMYQNVNKDTVG